MIRAKLDSHADRLTQSLAMKAAALARAKAEAARTKRQDGWREARLLWPLFTKGR